MINDTAVSGSEPPALVLSRDERRNLANALMRRLRLAPKIHSQGNAHRMMVFGPGRTKSLEPGTGYYALATRLEPKLPDLAQFAMLLTRSSYHRLYASLTMTYRFAWDGAVGERWRTQDELNLYLKQGGHYLKNCFVPLEYGNGETILTPARNYSKAATAGEMMIEFAIELINEDNPSLDIVRLESTECEFLDVA